MYSLGKQFRPYHIVILYNYLLLFYYTACVHLCFLTTLCVANLYEICIFKCTNFYLFLNYNTSTNFIELRIYEWSNFHHKLGVVLLE